MPSKSSIFERIAGLAASSGFRLSRWQPSVADCVRWLHEEGLTRDGHSLQADAKRDPEGLLDLGNPRVLGVPSHRVEKRRKSDLAVLKNQYTAVRLKFFEAIITIFESVGYTRLAVGTI